MKISRVLQVQFCHSMHRSTLQDSIYSTVYNVLGSVVWSAGITLHILQSSLALIKIISVPEFRLLPSTFQGVASMVAYQTVFSCILPFEGLWNKHI